MKTERLVVTGDGAAEARAAALLRRGGIVAIPTETVYGLAANALNEAAVAKIFAAKGRPQDNPLIVHISTIDALHQVAKEIPDIAFTLAAYFWPGPFTMVLPRNENVPACVSAGLDTVAVRLPESAVARKIISLSGLPLAAPSANRSGAPSPTTAEHVLSDLDGLIDAVVVADPARVGVESTVITLCTNPPRLLRPGAVTPEQLQVFLPDLAIDPAVLRQPEGTGPIASPGMKYKHYAPKTEITLIDADQRAFVDFVNQQPRGVAALCFSEDLCALTVPAVAYGSASNAEEQASRLFEALRELDGLGMQKAYARMPQKTGVGLAVYNRLIRAAAFRVISL